jgi:carbon-monoxide dehydrogenase medium subunit
VIPSTVDYVRPGSIEDALAELGAEDAKAIAGGHSLVPMMKLRLARPSRLVDLSALPLRGTTVEGDTIRIGALTTYDELLSRSDLPLPDTLRECAAAVGDVQVRNAGTIGGAIAHGDPASDFAAGVLATEATLVLQSLSGTREIAADAFFLGPFTTALEQQELLIELKIPVPERGEGSAYVSFADPASGYPLAGAAVRVRADGRQTIGLTGVAGRPLRIDGVADVAALDFSLHDDPDHRRQLAVVAVERAIDLARQRAGS